VPKTLAENDWNILLRRIADGKCTPFLGAGASYGSLPLGGEVAQEWARKEGYPFPDEHDLVRVAQYLAVKYDPTYPKEEILRRLHGAVPPDFRAADEPHGLLAELPLPVYMTTNYDDFMVRALKSRHRDPRRELCRWNALIQDEPSVFENEPAYKPTVANPLVYHLHGHTRAESLVLTEDDYLRFLGAVASEPNLLPQTVQAAIAGASLLFIGYRLADWNFRVLFHGLRPNALYRSVAVLVPPAGPDAVGAQEYLERYFAALDLRLFWGTAREFCAELRTRWDAFQ
jgi:hypothetical protein